MGTDVDQGGSATLPRLELRCAACDGKGKWTDDHNGTVYDCVECDGTGHVLTEFGREVMAFVRHAAARMRGEHRA